ncbi:MAG: GNAT family N-acetyltransferase [Lachnospiraceae bacterium]|nr:GNAT family N-acetyltransferase [Lachnospiraceae bacterium]
MVRFAEEKDLDRVNELRKQVNDIHVEGRPDIFKAGFGEEIRDFAKVILNGENSDIIVVERDGIICGMACVDYVNRPETAYGNPRSFYHVQEIAVDEAFRRQGVARELFEFMKKDAQQRKLPQIELDVWEFNESAREFYEAVGFKETRRWMEFGVE